MSAYADLAAARPVLDPETPFVDVLDALADAVLAVVKVVDYVRDADFGEEFEARTTDEQTDMGIAVTLAILTLEKGVLEIGDTVADVFEAAV